MHTSHIFSPYITNCEYVTLRTKLLLGKSLLVTEYWTVLKIFLTGIAIFKKQTNSAFRALVHVPLSPDDAMPHIRLHSRTWSPWLTEIWSITISCYEVHMNGLSLFLQLVGSSETLHADLGWINPSILNWNKICPTFSYHHQYQNTWNMVHDKVRKLWQV